MATTRRYDQACPLATALDIVGTRWALLLVRELILGPLRFSEIEAGLETASTDMVTTRLRELEAAGLIERTNDRRYQLTTIGFGLVPAIDALNQWTAQLTHGVPQPSPDGTVDLIRRLMTLVAVRARTHTFESDHGQLIVRCEHIQAVAAPVDAYYVLLANEIEVDPAAPSTITFSAEGLRSFMFGQRSLEMLLNSSDVVVTGHGAAFLRELDPVISV